MSSRVPILAAGAAFLVAAGFASGALAATNDTFGSSQPTVQSGNQRDNATLGCLKISGPHSLNSCGQTPAGAARSLAIPGYSRVGPGKLGHSRFRRM